MDRVCDTCGYRINRVLIFLFVSFIFSGSFTNHLVAGPKNEIIGKAFKIQSSILNEERILHISLPAGYEKTQKSYPVLYQLDGTARRFPEAARQIRDIASAGEIPGMILVGIENTDRWRDMLPVKLERYPSSGEAAGFFKFLKNEVIPYIEGKYRTNHSRILYGRSNSALFTVFALTENAAVFTGYIVCSPSLGHCKDYIFHRMASFTGKPSKKGRFLFISNGGRDSAIRLVKPIPEFIEIIKRKDPQNLILRYRYYEKGGHCPSPTLRDGLVLFFRHLKEKDTTYYDRQPPGFTPKPFAPGLISTKKYSEAGCTFTLDGNEFYFTRSGGGLDAPTIFVSRFQDNKWTQPEKAPLPGFGPHVSPDGKKIFVSKYQYNKENQRIIELWYADREEKGWSDLKYHGPGNRPSMSSAGSLYFIDRSDEKDRGVIVVQNFAAGKYLEPEIPGGGINTSYYEAHPCIAKDESYIIFDSNRPGGYGQGDLYICFRDDDGRWGKAINLGPSINTKRYEAYSSISHDGKFLFYSSNKDGTFDLYRVELDIIKSIRYPLQ